MKKIALIVLLLAVVVGVYDVNIYWRGARGVLYAVSYFRQPSMSGTTTVRGIDANIRIDYDTHGVPHVRAKTWQDAIFGQGYIIAKHRLWQLEFYRRVATATAFQLLGDKVEPLDRLFYDYGFDRHAAKSWRDVLAAKNESSVGVQIVRRYVAGINAYVLSPDDYVPPLEFALSSYGFNGRVPAFTEVDVLAVATMSSWQMTRGGEHELMRAAKRVLIDDDALFGEIEIDQMLEFVPTLPKGIEVNRRRSAAADDAIPFGDAVGEAAGGSNCWAIGGDYTRSGRPMLGSDPHLLPTEPSVWYLLHLRSDDDVLNVAGMAFVGAPLVSIGHNEHMAFGATLSYLDATDWVLETLRASDGNASSPPDEYLFEGEWLPLKVHTRDDGSAPYALSAMETHHGPLVTMMSDLFAASSSKQHDARDAGSDADPSIRYALAMETIALRTESVLLNDDVLLLNAARDFDEFSRGVAAYTQVSLNLPFVHVDGSYGYWQSGSVPVRRAAAGDHERARGPSVPRRGAIAESEWDSFLPASQQPHALNPAHGYVVSANNRVVEDDDYDHYLSDTYCNSGYYRAKRAAQLIEQAEPRSIDAAAITRMQRDVLSLPAAKAVELLRALDAKLPAGGLDALSPAMSAVWAKLRDFDGSLHGASSAAAYFKFFESAMLSALFDDTVSALADGDVAASEYVRGRHLTLVPRPVSEFSARDTILLVRFLGDADDSLIVQRAGGIAQVLAAAAESTIAALEREFGPHHVAAARWDRVHTHEWRHVLGRVLPKLFNVDAVPVGGDENCLFQTGTLVHEGFAAVGFTPSAQLVFDTADWDQSTESVPPGQSANMASPFYSHAVDSFHRFDVKPMPHHYSEAAIEANKYSTFHLVREE
jgi:penicillin G amidase